LRRLFCAKQVVMFSWERKAQHFWQFTFQKLHLILETIQKGVLFCCAQQ